MAPIVFIIFDTKFSPSLLSLPVLLIETFRNPSGQAMLRITWFLFLNTKIPCFFSSLAISGVILLYPLKILFNSFLFSIFLISTSIIVARNRRIVDSSAVKKANLYFFLFGFICLPRFP